MIQMQRLHARRLRLLPRRRQRDILYNRLKKPVIGYKGVIIKRMCPAESCADRPVNPVRLAPSASAMEDVVMSTVTATSTTDGQDASDTVVKLTVHLRPKGGKKGNHLNANVSVLDYKLLTYQFLCVFVARKPIFRVSEA